MKAGEVLGLLAGLGAINALRGGRDGAGPRFTGLLDMIDGGGAGRSGDRFEGGGLLSALGNLFAKPYEAQDRVERIAAATRSGNGGMTLRPRARPEMTFGNTPVGGGMPAARPMMFGDTPVGSMPAASSDMMFGDTPVGSMPAAPTQMVRPEGPAAGMPQDAQAVSGMPAPMPARDMFGLNGPQTIDRSLADRFAEIHRQIQQDLNMSAVELAELRANNREQYDRLVSIYSRYGY